MGRLKSKIVIAAAACFLAVLVLFRIEADAQNNRGAGVRPANSPSSEKRLALVIGNGAYQKTDALANPVNDATDVAAALRDLGFEVISGTNQTRQGMESLIRQFGSRLAETKAVGLFFYAGHGISSGGTNYLIPVDADIQAEDEIEYSSVSINFVLGKMAAAGNGFNMVILDACRNNPFARKWRNYRDASDKGGLARIDAPTGTLIAYATRPGDVASDGAGRNGLYTGALLKQMRVKNVEMGKMFQRVRAEVINQSGGKQVPFDESSVVGDFYFAGMENAPPIVNNNINAVSVEKEFWDSIKNSTDPEDFKLYKEKYPGGDYSALADLKIRQLTRSNIPTRSYDRELSQKFKDNCYNFNDKGNYDSGITECTKAIEADPTFADPYVERGYAYMGKNVYELALADFTKAIELNPKLVTAYSNRGTTYYFKGMYDLALADFTKAIEIEPTPFRFRKRADAYEKKGDKNLAAADRAKADELEKKKK